jgi:hypothetical protein
LEDTTMKRLAAATGALLMATFAGAQSSDDRAVPRSGSSGASGSASGSASDSGSRHTSGSSGSSSADWSRSDNDRSRSSVPDAAARRPRPGTGTGDRGYGGRYDGGGYYRNTYSSYYYDPFYYGYGWGYRPGRYSGYGYYDYGYGYGDYWGYYPTRAYRYRDGNIAQLRVIVEPAKARVYVDGYYAGIADDYDGIFQRLTVSPGRHDITLKLEGYKTHTFRVYANREQTLKLRYDMVKGSGETDENVGEETPDPVREFEPARADRPAGRATEEPRYVPPTSRERGLVEITVDPPDASIYVDGEFYGKAGDIRELELLPGRHRIEVVRPGYKTDEREIEIAARRNPAVRIRLEKP